MTQKEKAISLMKQLGIHKPYITGFDKKDNVCFYENYAGFWAYQEPELMAKIKDFEQSNGAIVYAVTHEYLEFGECYDFLFVPKDKEDWDDLVEDLGNGRFYAYAYVWNKDCTWCSEYGTIYIRSFGGGIKRIS